MHLLTLLDDLPELLLNEHGTGSYFPDFDHSIKIVDPINRHSLPQMRQFGSQELLPLMAFPVQSRSVLDDCGSQYTLLESLPVEELNAARLHVGYMLEHAWNVGNPKLH